MSNALLSRADGAIVANLVREVLERHFRHGRSPRANVRAATRQASKHREDSSEWERDRQLLQRVAYGAPRPTRLNTVRRVAEMLERIEPGAASRIAPLERQQEARQLLAKRWVAMKWASPAKPMELVKVKHQLRQDGELVQLKEFRDWARSRWHHAWRISVAERRILEPLVCYDRTGGIERGWGNFSARERRNFIRWGVLREKLLLRGGTAESRALAALHGKAPRVSPREYLITHGLDTPRSKQMLRKLGLTAEEFRQREQELARFRAELESSPD